MDQVKHSEGDKGTDRLTDRHTTQTDRPRRTSKTVRNVVSGLRLAAATVIKVVLFRRGASRYNRRCERLA